METDVSGQLDLYAGRPERAGRAGSVPDTWVQLPVRDVITEAQYGLSMQMGKSGQYPILRMAAIQDGDVLLDDLKYVDLPEELAAQYLVRRGDVLFNRTNSADLVGKVGVYRKDEPVVFASYLIRLKVRETVVDSYFLGQLLASKAAQSAIRRYATPGVQQVNINATNLGKVLICIPTGAGGLREQETIASILEAADAAVGRTRDAIVKADRLRRAVLRKLLSCGVNEQGRIRDSRRGFQRSTVGTIPTEWGVSRVGVEFDIASGFTLGEHRRPRLHPQKYLRVANVQRSKILLDDVALLEATEAEMADKRLQENDLLVVEGHADPDEIGRCAIVRRDAVGLAFQNHLFRLRAKRLSPEFACLWLNSAWSRRFWRRMCATSSGLNTINQRMLRSLQIVMPPPDEQNRIALLAKSHDDYIDRLTGYLDKLCALKTGLSQVLLTGRVRVRAPFRVPS